MHHGLRVAVRWSRVCWFQWGEPRSGPSNSTFPPIQDVGIYLVFMLPSTQTKNSFLSAAQFHKTKVNNFNCASSSFNKKESITDTVKMLCGYSVKQSIFVIRSQSEGACTWLQARPLASHCCALGTAYFKVLRGVQCSHTHRPGEKWSCGAL